MNDEEQVQMVRDHSHARILHKLWRALDEENADNIYNTEERLMIKKVVLLLSRKEDELKQKYDHQEWYSLGDYTLFR